MDEREAGSESSQEAAEEPTESKNNSEGIAAAVPNDDERDLQEGRSGDALAWLEGPAFKEPVEEMPTLRWADGQKDSDDKDSKPSSTEIGQSDDDIAVADEAPAKKPDQMSEEQGMAMEETPTLVTSREPDLAKSAADANEVEPLGTTTPLSDLDSDPMAWLEQLAIDQDSPLEELPSVADRLLASEIVSQINSELDNASSVEPLTSQAVELDDAIRYLESQAEAQGVSLDNVSFDESEQIESLDEELDSLDQMVIASVPAVIEKSEPDLPDEPYEGDEWDDLSTQIPEDPDEALAWLGALSEEENNAESDSDRSVLAKGATAAVAAKVVRSGDDDTSGEELVVEVVTDEQALDADTLEGMPDDPDEAMVWMEGLAAQDETAPVDRVITGSDEESEQLAVDFFEGAEDTKNEGFAPARAALAAGAVGMATKHYRKLLDDGQGGPEMIAELEAAVSEQPDDLELVQLLGDAYMQEGQLQKALNSYRKGFDHL